MAITVQPAPASVLVGAFAVFTVSASGTPAPAFQWQQSDSSGSSYLDIAGATAAAYTTPPTVLGDDGRLFRVRVSNAVNSVVSQAARLTVATTGVAPTITTHLVPQFAVEGTTATFTVVATGTPTPRFLWQVSADRGQSYATIPGAVGPSYTTPPTTKSDHGKLFRVLALNSAGSDVSQNSLTVWGLYQVGGTATDLNGYLTMRLGSEIIVLRGSGPFSFPTKLPEGQPYASLILEQPPGQTCTLVNPTGVVTPNSVINVSCGRMHYMSLFAGDVGSASYSDGPAREAHFNLPSGLTFDRAGNLFIADANNSLVRKVSPAGVVSTMAGQPGFGGTMDGIGSAARFSRPTALVADTAGNLFVADGGMIRKVTPAGVVTTFAGGGTDPAIYDGQGNSARFSSLTDGIVFDRSGNLFVTDGSGSHTIRKITPDGTVSTYAGAHGAVGSVDGDRLSARFNLPRGLAIDKDDNLFVADVENSTVRKITPAGVVSTIAGSAGQKGYQDRNGAEARFDGIGGITVDIAGNVYISERGFNTIRQIRPSGDVFTLAGDPNAGAGDADGLLLDARFRDPFGLTMGPDGLVYIADSQNHRVRTMSTDGLTGTVAGTPARFGTTDAAGAAARFQGVQGIVVDAAGNFIVSDMQNHTIRRVAPDGAVTTVAGTAGVRGWSDGVGAAASFTSPVGAAIDGAGNIFVADYDNHLIRKLSPNGTVSTVAGVPRVSGYADGPASTALFDLPYAIAVDSRGVLYVTEEGSDTVRTIGTDGTVSTLAGINWNRDSSVGCQFADGAGAAARFCFPRGILVDAQDQILVADSINDAIRKITPSGTVSTLVRGVGAGGLVQDAAGNLYVADNERIHKVTAGGVEFGVVGRPANRAFVPGPLPGLIPNAAFLAIKDGKLYVTFGGSGIAVVDPMP